MKSDYEHVLKRYQQIEKSVNSQLTNDKTKLLSSIRDHINSSDVIFLNSNLKSCHEIFSFCLDISIHKNFNLF